MKNAYSSEGIFGFYRGFWTTVMRDVPFSMLQLPIWEYLKQEYKIFTGKPLTTLEVAFCGSISGYCHQAICRYAISVCFVLILYIL